MWVDYALKNDAIILYDCAYEAFITEDLPRSIFAIEGARSCAIEMCSLSKTAGFTGTRCGYTVIPKELERDVFRGLFNVRLPLYSVKRVKSRLKRISLIIRRMQELLHLPLMSLVFITRAAKILRTFGLSVRTIWEAGNFLICFSMRQM